MTPSGAWICSGCEAGCDGMACGTRTVHGVLLGLCDLCIDFLDRDRRNHERIPRWIAEAAERKLRKARP